MSDVFRKKFLKSWKVFSFLVFSWALILLCFIFGFFDSTQAKIYDRFFVRKTPPLEIVVVAIDDESITNLGGWPMERRVFGRVIEQMSMAKSIAFDVSFTENSRYGEMDDRYFEEALKNKTTQISLASQFDDRGQKLILPLERFLKNASPAFANVILNDDGLVRTFRPKIDEEISLSLSNLREEREFPDVVVIDYYGPAKTFPNIPLIDVYNGSIPKEAFKDKMIFIGATAPDLHDILQTPFGAMPGVEIHANALSTLKKGEFFTPLSTPYVALLMLCFGLLALYTILKLKRISSMILSLTLELVFIQLISIVAFRFYLQVPNLYISLSFLLLSAFLVLYQYFSESKEKKMIRSMFQYYLMPEVVNELVQNPEKLRLGGEKRKMTILFSDIRGFTTISEKLSPETLTSLLNEYLTDMTEAVMKHKGFVDKYIGDAIMAFWGAPVLNPNQVKDACLTVLKMSEMLRNLNLKWKEKGLPELGIGVGVNTGEVIVGNIGSNARFNYTVIGDEVNFASRLEGLNKVYGTQCILSESSKKEIENDQTFVLRELDLVTVKGKTEPKLIFELITRPVDDKLTEILKEFSLGRRLYINADFKNAKTHFEKALSLGEDGPSKVFLERCEFLEQNPPSSWNGVYEFKTK